MTVVFRIKSDLKLDQYLKNVENKKLPPIVKKYAFAIQGEAAKNAPVDTGALKNSIQAEPIDERNWTVSDGVEYGIYQELGQPPKAKKPHFLGNACEKFADKFFDEIKEALK